MVEKGGSAKWEQLEMGEIRAIPGPPPGLLGTQTPRGAGLDPLPPPCRVLSLEGRGAAVPHSRRGRGGRLEPPHKVWSPESAELARFGVGWGEVGKRRCGRDMALDAPSRH